MKTACDGCVRLRKVYGNRDKTGKRVQSGVFCVARNGRLSHRPKECKDRKQA